jgi:hypothetical protein
MVAEFMEKSLKKGITDEGLAEESKVKGNDYVPVGRKASLNRHLAAGKFWQLSEQGDKLVGKFQSRNLREPDCLLGGNIEREHDERRNFLFQRASVGAAAVGLTVCGGQVLFSGDRVGAVDSDLRFERVAYDAQLGVLERSSRFPRGRFVHNSFPRSQIWDGGKSDGLRWQIAREYNLRGGVEISPRR